MNKIEIEGYTISLEDLNDETKIENLCRLIAVKRWAKQLSQFFDENDVDFIL